VEVSPHSQRIALLRLTRRRRLVDSTDGRANNIAQEGGQHCALALLAYLAVQPEVEAVELTRPVKHFSVPPAAPKQPQPQPQPPTQSQPLPPVPLPLPHLSFPLLPAEEDGHRRRSNSTRPPTEQRSLNADSVAALQSRWVGE
jgi:hypothetical protein